MTRRTFLDTMFRMIRGAATACVAVPVVRFLLAPLQAKRRRDRYLRLVPLAQLQSNDARRVQVVADRWDAFTHYPPGPMGSVWLVREVGESDKPRIRCFQTICPHLGCSVNQDSEQGGFRCPCHGAVFDAAGNPVAGPSPRGMDELDVRIVEDEDGQRWVEARFQTFVVGTTQRTPTA